LSRNCKPTLGNRKTKNGGQPAGKSQKTYKWGALRQFGPMEKKKSEAKKKEEGVTSGWKQKAEKKKEQGRWGCSSFPSVLEKSG